MAARDCLKGRLFFSGEWFDDKVAISLYQLHPGQPFFAAEPYRVR
jgi:hypothetical protein